MFSKILGAIIAAAAVALAIFVTPRSAPPVDDAVQQTAVQFNDRPQRVDPPNSASSVSPQAGHPFLAPIDSENSRRELSLLDRLLSPYSSEDESWMLRVGYPRQSDIYGAIPDEELRRRVADFERGADAYSASVLAARLFRQGSEEWKAIAKRFSDMSPFLARLELEHELSKLPEDRASANVINRLAMRAMLLGDQDVGRIHSRQFNQFAWEEMSWLLESMDAVNQMLALQGKPPLPTAIRPTPTLRP